MTLFLHQVLTMLIILLESYEQYFTVAYVRLVTVLTHA